MNIPAVLIVDDEAPIRTALTDRLEAENMKVLAAHDGVEGLNTALADKPDLILLDIVMPRMDGLTMLARLREDEWGRNARVILLTNLSDNLSLAASLEKGVFDYLVKSDWTINEMVQKVKAKLAETPAAGRRAL